MIPERYLNFVSEISGKFPIGNFGKLPRPIPRHIVIWRMVLCNLYQFILAYIIHSPIYSHFRIIWLFISINEVLKLRKSTELNCPVHSVRQLDN